MRRVIDRHCARAALRRTVSTSVNFVGESSCATVIVPSPQEAKANPVTGSKRFASTPCPMGTVSSTFPVLPSTNAIILLWQPTTRISCAASIASPEGDSQGARGQVFSIFRVFASNFTSALLSSRFTNIFPLPSEAPNSGPPPSANVLIVLPVAASMAVDVLASPLNVNTRFENGS